MLQETSNHVNYQAAMFLFEYISEGQSLSRSFPRFLRICELKLSLRANNVNIQLFVTCFVDKYNHLFRFIRVKTKHVGNWICLCAVQVRYFWHHES